MLLWHSSLFETGVMLDLPTSDTLAEAGPVAEDTLAEAGPVAAGTLAAADPVAEGTK